MHVGTAVAPHVRSRDRGRLRGEYLMFFREGCEQAARGLRFDLAAKRRLACFHGNGVYRVSERGRPLDKVSVGVHDTVNFRREAQANKNGDRVSEHIGFHCCLLPNPEC